MNYCVLDNDGLVSNIIVCENDDIAKKFNALPYYEGASIGTRYSPPPEPTTLERLEALETGLRETKSAQDDTDALLVDQEYRLTLMELGVTEEV